MKETKGWIYFDKLFMRITLAVLGLSFFVFLLMVLLIDYIGKVTDIVLAPVLMMLFTSAVVFFIHVIRFFKYLIKKASLEEGATITRSLLGIVISPVAFGIYYVIIIIIAFASCTIV